MRGLTSLVILAMILPSASAVFLLAVVQDVYVEDSIGDATINGVPADHLDITHVQLSIEDNSILVVEMGLVDAAAAQDLSNQRPSTAYYWVELDYHGERFDVAWNHDFSRFADESGEIQDLTQAELMREDASGWTVIADQPATTDREQSRLIARFDLASMVDSKGFTPGPGERISVLSGRSYFDGGNDPKNPPPPGGAAAAMDGKAYGTDDAEFPAGTFLDISGEASETIGVGTSNPIRFSNGEATTYHWPVRVVNHEDTPIDLLVELDADPAFDVHAPQSLQVPALSEAIADVYASAPFAHKHGESRHLTVHLTGDGIEASLDLEVHYLDVPQPSGHHPFVYMHAFNPGNGQSGYRWMDTIEKPVRDAHAVIEFGNAFCGSDTETALGDGLVFPLDPSLNVGVDARVDETIHFTATMDHQSFRPAGSVLAALVPYDRITTQDVSRLADESMPHAFGVQKLGQASTGEQVDLDMHLPVPAELDLVEPGSTMNLAFVVMYCADDVNQNNARNVAVAEDLQTTLQEASIFLPFDDYHDLVNIDLDRGLELLVDQPARSAAPGAQVLWNIDVNGEGDDPIMVQILGAGADWVTVHGDDLQIGDPILVSATIPRDALHGHTDIIVEVVDSEDLTRRAAARLSLNVDPTAPDDDTAQITALNDAETRNTPFGAAVLPMGMLVAAWIVRRRRP